MISCGTSARNDVQAWAAELEVETYVGTSGRVFPRGQKAAGLLRAWVRRCERGACNSARRTAHGHFAKFEWLVGSVAEVGRGVFDRSVRGRASLWAGPSWPETGSDGSWPAILAGHGMEITPWDCANCGWEVDWPAEFLPRAEGLPLKNLTVSAGGRECFGRIAHYSLWPRRRGHLSAWADAARDGSAGDHNRSEATTFRGGDSRSPREYVSSR